MDSAQYLRWTRWYNLPLAHCQRPSVFGIHANNQRHFAYYRFHKRLGKGNWNRYIERYTKPRSIENTQNITFNYRASFQAAKNSASYLWELPKRIAAATSSNDLLDAWIYFRHKRKKVYHFILALKRLCEIKDVDTSDWRFQHIAKKLLKRSKYFIDLPNVCRYLGQLRATPTLDKLTMLICENLERYTPNQLGLIAGAFGHCRLHSKYLFSLLAQRLEANMHLATNQDLIAVADAFGKCMIYNYGTLASISLEIQRRLADEFVKPNVPVELFTTPNRHCMLNIQNPITVSITRPSMLELGVVEAFAATKYRDMFICDVLSQMLRYELARGRVDDVCNPNIVTRALRAYRSMKVNDIPLFVSILDHAAKQPYDYPPRCLSEVGLHLSYLLPRNLDAVAEKFAACLDELKLHLSRMDPRQLTNTAIFAYKAITSTVTKSDILSQISQAMLNHRNNMVKYDAPKMMEVLSMHNSLNEECFNTICRDIYRVISLFEPADYQRTARVLRKLRSQDLTNIKMVNMLAKHVINQHEEFSDFQYHCVARDLTLAGPPYQSLLADLWKHNRCQRGFSPKLEESLTAQSN
ncbi:hypothetical protein BgAZ_303770 [Babesia gibsoni]|uniref:Uncharacterized protein n=1 Tax=Babesia gibsoni TaxID=33632 RepID=A0AAD8LIK8_BABGI|nr:hypothetical protein BgAZ_303770 [Babesia gibsoni]